MPRDSVQGSFFCIHKYDRYNAVIYSDRSVRVYDIYGSGFLFGTTLDKLSEEHIEKMLMLK